MKCEKCNNEARAGWTRCDFHLAVARICFSSVQDALPVIKTAPLPVLKAARQQEEAAERPRRTITARLEGRIRKINQAREQLLSGKPKTNALL